MSNAYQYIVYDMNGKNRGTFNGVVNKQTLVKLARENHGSVLVKKNISKNNDLIKNRNKKNFDLALIKQSPRNFVLNIDSLNSETWLEIEKNEIVKICIDNPVLAWETSLNSSIFNDSCLAFQAPILVGVEKIKVFFPEPNVSHNINLAVGMKFLNLKNEEVVLGYNEESENFYRKVGFPRYYDMERFATVKGTFLVDKYPVTNCDYLQMMWDSIPREATLDAPFIQEVHKDWISRKKNIIHNEECEVHDTAAPQISLYQAMKYANARSIRDGLKPYYYFSKAEAKFESIIPNGYIIVYWDFKDINSRHLKVSIDKTSDGYRLPYLDEWMMFARGGDKKNKAPWGDPATVSLEEASKYAIFTTDLKSDNETEPVGQLRPNGYGLYDIFGLVEERVLLKGILFGNFGFPSCLKGGVYTIKDTVGEFSSARPYWRELNYGYFGTGTSGLSGFRLIRNIGNNASVENIKYKVEDYWFD